MTRCWSRPGCTRRARCSIPGNAAEGVIAALDYLVASNRKGFGDAVPEFDDGTPECRGQERRRHRRRRHRDGLRAHCGAPGRQVGEMPLSPRPREHAGLAARSVERRGRRRRFRLAVGPRKLHRRQERQAGRGRRHAAGRPRRQRSTQPRNRPRPPVRPAQRHGDQGACAAKAKNCRTCSAPPTSASRAGGRCASIIRR